MYMNTREAFGAIPVIGTFVGAITLIKTKINEHLSPTDKKIRRILSTERTIPEKTGQIHELLGKKTKFKEAPPYISPEGKTSHEIYSYYQTLIREQSINKHNALWELFPFFGTIHHLARSHLHNWRGSETSIDVKAAIRTLKILGRPEDVELVQNAYEDVMEFPSTPGVPSPKRDAAKETLRSLIGYLIHPKEVTEAFIEDTIAKGFRLKMISETEAQELRAAFKDYQANPSKEAGLRIHRMIDFCLRRNELSLPDWFQRFSERVRQK